MIQRRSLCLAGAALALLAPPAFAGLASVHVRGTVRIVEDGRPASGGDIGKFTMTGAFKDSGTLRTNFVSAHGKAVNLKRLLVGSQGKILFKLTITTNGTNVGPITSVWTILSGTGAYAGLHGTGTSKGYLKANNAGYHEVVTGAVSR
jgi:hypothetical protein